MRKKFEDVLDIINGKNQKKVENPRGVYPIYGSGGVMGYADDYICEANTVIIGRKGSINNPIYVEEPFWNVDTAFGLAARENVLLPKYLYFFCVYYDFEKLNTTVTIPSLTKANLLKVEIDVPSIDEQEKIVDKLDSIAKLIQLQKELIKQYELLIKSRFLEMFGNGHDGVCETRLLGGFCKFQQGTQVPVEEQIEEQLEGYIRFLRIIDYTQAPQPPRYVSVKGREVEEDSVVIVRYGATAGFVGHGYTGVLANNLFEIVPDKSILEKNFLYFALKYGTFEQEIHDKAFGAAMPALSFGMMNDISVVTPSIDKQKSFVEFAHQVDKLKTTEQKRLEKLQLLFNSLMQKYFG
ncbi:MAG: restriction endonuclease subunit S [Lachnospiraceae bacterium]|nr:restriction endonuclease subunit S [Lachnospiraceae bacterium]